MLDREIDVSRGDVLVHPGATPDYSNQFQARIVWMSEEQAIPGRSYLLKIGSQVVPASITDLKFRTNVNTLEESAAKTLELNEVGTRDHRHRQADRLRQLRRQRARPAASS